MITQCLSLSLSLSLSLPLSPPLSVFLFLSLGLALIFFCYNSHLKNFFVSFHANDLPLPHLICTLYIVSTTPKNFAPPSQRFNVVFHLPLYILISIALQISLLPDDGLGNPDRNVVFFEIIVGEMRDPCLEYIL